MPEIIKFTDITPTIQPEFHPSIESIKQMSFKALIKHQLNAIEYCLRGFNPIYNITFVFDNIRSPPNYPNNSEPDKKIDFKNIKHITFGLHLN